ncbi:SGNH/GDSL hydrolase family protein [Spirosoma aerolatum]|uniref:SGNH/GDSL hydrolase family protein n=1 Tax=Spirosoma aerolatum TaxID=1211326 RepID=UPI0012D2BC5A|nr:SGNH/GDSL hydrolase family protein [Spirosoma aerolatum]
MKVILIGGCHVGNYAIAPHLGFVQKWTEHLAYLTDEPIQTLCHSMVSLSQVADLITQHRVELMQADQIVLQLGHYELSWRKCFRELFQHQLFSPTPKPYQPKPLPNITGTAPIPYQQKLKNWFKAAFLTLYKTQNSQLPYLKQFDQRLTQTLALLAPYGAKVIVMTPFPSLHAVDQWLRRESIPFICKCARQNGFRLVDTFSAIPRQAAYFLADGAHLNARGHAIVALLLSQLPVYTTLLEEINCL